MEPTQRAYQDVRLRIYYDPGLSDPPANWNFKELFDTVGEDTIVLEASRPTFLDSAGNPEE